MRVGPELRDQIPSVPTSAPKFTPQPGLRVHRALPARRYGQAAWEPGASRQDREGRGRYGGGVSHRFPCRQPGAQMALAGTRGTTWRPGRRRWAEGPEWAASSAAGQLFLGPWQAASVVLGSRHLLESRRPWAMGGAVHRVWQKCIWPRGTGMSASETLAETELWVRAIEAAQQGLTPDFQSGAPPTILGSSLLLTWES